MSLDLDTRQYRMLQAMGLGWLEAVQPTAVAAPKRPAQPPVARAEPIFKPNQPLVTDSIGLTATKIEVIRAPVIDPSWADLDAAALRTAVSGCRACSLCEGRRSAIVGNGASAGRVLWVTEAPNEADDAANEPFADQAGQLLDAMLKSIQLSRAASRAASRAVTDEANPLGAGVFVTHAVKCRPHANRAPSIDELAACAPILSRQIELLRPQLIVAGGRVAVQQVLGSVEPLGKLRGRVHAALPQFGGGAVVVTYHPSYLLRSPSEKAKAWEDLCLVAQTLDDMPHSPP